MSKAKEGKRIKGSRVVHIKEDKWEYKIGRYNAVIVSPLGNKQIIDLRDIVKVVKKLSQFGSSEFFWDREEGDPNKGSIKPEEMRTFIAMNYYGKSLWEIEHA